MILDLKNDINLGDVTLINFVNLSGEESRLVMGWRNHDNIRKWMYTDHIIMPDEHHKYLEQLKTDRKNFYWLCRQNGLDKYLGVIYLNRVNMQNKNAFLGIYVDPFMQSSGMGRLLLSALRKLAFEIMNLHTLKSEVLETNERAISLYKRFSFEEEGCLKEFVLRDGKWLDVIILGLSKLSDDKDKYGRVEKREI